MELNNKCSMSQEGILMNLNKGLEAERRALALCLELAKMPLSEEEKSQVEKIGRDEERHIKITDNLIKIIQDSYQGQK